MENRALIVEFGVSKLYRIQEGNNWIITGAKSTPMGRGKLEKEIENDSLLEMIFKHAFNPSEVFNQVKGHLSQKEIEKFESNFLSQIDGLKKVEFKDLLYSIALDSTVAFTFKPRSFGHIYGECDRVAITKSELIKEVNDVLPEKLDLLIPFLDEPELNEINKLIKKNYTLRIKNLGKQKKSTIGLIEFEIKKRKVKRTKQCIEKFLLPQELRDFDIGKLEDKSLQYIGDFAIGEGIGQEVTSLLFGGNVKNGYRLAYEMINTLDDDWDENRHTGEYLIAAFADFKGCLSGIYTILPYLDDFQSALIAIKEKVKSDEEKVLIDRILTCLDLHLELNVM